jgi:hypothetical protein
VIDLSRYVFEALRKDEEFVLYRGRAAFASRLRQATARPESSEVQNDVSGRSVGSAESGSGTPLILDEGNASQEPRRSVSHSRFLVLSPAVQRPTPESVKRLEHEYSLLNRTG